METMDNGVVIGAFEVCNAETKAVFFAQRCATRCLT